VFGNAPTRQLEDTKPSAVPIYFSGIQAKIRKPHMMYIYATNKDSNPMSLTP